MLHTRPNIPPDDLSALRLMMEWGADDALLDAPIDRLAAPPQPDGADTVITPPPAPARRTAAQRAATAAGSVVQQAQAAAAGAPDLAALHAALDAFDACPLRATASHSVHPAGDPAAGLVMLYEAPGPDDDRSGTPLAGPLGARVDRMLASAGLDRGRMLIAPVIPWRPPGGRPVNETELAACLPFLLRLLALVGPRRLVLLGAGPLRALGGPENGFRKARGTWLPLPLPGLDQPVPALPMLPPERWLADATSRRATWLDLLALRSALDGQS